MTVEFGPATGGESYIPCPQCDGAESEVETATGAVLQYRCHECGWSWFVMTHDPARDRPLSTDEMDVLRRLRRSLERSRRATAH